TGTITITLKHNSPSNSYLYELWRQQDDPSAEPITILVQDRHFDGDVSIGGSERKIVNLPAFSRGDEMEDAEWEFLVADYEAACNIQRGDTMPKQPKPATLTVSGRTYKLRHPGGRRAMQNGDRARGTEGAIQTAVYAQSLLDHVVADPAGLTLDDFESVGELEGVIRQIEEFLRS